MHYIENIVVAVCVTAGIIATLILGFGWMEDATENRQKNLHAEKIACMENATDDVTLLACKGSGLAR